MSRIRSSKRLSELRGSAPLFAALGDETRLRLLSRLSDHGPMSITRLAAGSRITRQAVSKHLRVMERAGLVRSGRRGRETVCELERRRLEDARHYLDLISRQWDDALGRLQALVEEPDKPARAISSASSERIPGVHSRSE